MKRQWGWLLVSFALAGGLVSLLGISQEKNARQGGRTWTVCVQGCDFTSIQQAIDTVETGDRIWIKPGIYAEHLVIRRSVTLEGSGKGETVIKGAQPNKPIIFIPGPVPIEVRLANLALIESFTHDGEPRFCDPVLDVGRCAAGIEVGGPVQLSLHHMRLEKHSSGIWVRGPARLQLFESQIGSAFIFGIELSHHDAEVTIVNSEISIGFSQSSYEYFPKTGLLATDARRVTVMNSSFSGDEAIRADGQVQVAVINTRFSGGGVGLGSSYTGAKVQAVILNSEFVESGLGLAVGDESQITVVNSRFKKGGISLSGQTRAVIYGSEIVENEYSGVYLSDKVQVHLERNRIADNKGWGIALWVPECFTTLGERATPQISGRDNEIPDKDQPNGNKKGALCPPDYPWPPGFRK